MIETYLLFIQIDIFPRVVHILKSYLGCKHVAESAKQIQSVCSCCISASLHALRRFSMAVWK